MAKNENGYVEINRFIDTKPMFGDWEIDVLLAFCICMVATFMLTKGMIAMAIGVALSVAVAKFYEKMKKSKIKGFFFHLLYMLGFRIPKTMPPSYMRHFLGA